ncbi:MAG: hypothetical protein Q8Q74_11425 [Polaromonas sp.]|nr:hypothetical protein [Polaromonas sp.]
MGALFGASTPAPSPRTRAGTSSRASTDGKVSGLPTTPLVRQSDVASGSAAGRREPRDGGDPSVPVPSDLHMALQHESLLFNLFCNNQHVSRSFEQRLAKDAERGFTHSGIRPSPLAGLDDDLQTLAGTGQCALLASNDGLCLGAVGWSDEEAEQMAGRLALESGQANTAPVLTWFFARERVVLCADPGVDQRDPAWVGVARRLLRACGPLRLEPGLA